MYMLSKLWSYNLISSIKKKGGINMFETSKQRIDALKRGITMDTIEHYYLATNNITLVGVKWIPCPYRGV